MEKDLSILEKMWLWVDFSVESECKKKFNTTFGWMIAIDEWMTYNGAAHECSERLGVLATVNSRSKIDELSTVLANECTDKYGTLVWRYNVLWRVGLKTLEGIGQWENGVLFVAEFDSYGLFRELSETRIGLVIT